MISGIDTVSTTTWLGLAMFLASIGAASGFVGLKLRQWSDRDPCSGIFVNLLGGFILPIAAALGMGHLVSRTIADDPCQGLPTSVRTGLIACAAMIVLVSALLTFWSAAARR